MKILIADDEPNICKLIKNLIDWDSLGLELIGFAYNGNESYDMITAHSPDIVITDIRMPGKNGLDIINDCLGQGLDIQFIIVTGHAEFDYARQAIKYGINDFLLKPVNREELNDALTRVIKRLLDASEREQVIEEKLENSRTILRNSLLVLLHHRDFGPNDRSVEALNDEFGFQFREGVFMPVIFKLYVNGKKTSHANRICDQMKLIVERELHSISTDLCIYEKSLSLLCLFNFPEHQLNEFQIALQYTLDVLLDLITPYNLYQVVLGTGTGTHTISELQASFLQAVCASKSRLYLGGNQIINGMNMETRLLNSTMISVEEPNRALQSIIELLDAEKFPAILRKEFRRQMPDMTLYPYSINSYIRKFIAALLRDISAIYDLKNSQYSNEQNIFSNVIKCYSLDEAETELTKRFGMLMEELQANSTDRKTIKVVKNYIELNFGQRIRLEDVAEKVFLSPAYLGILFKRETGQNFSDYLVTVRIEKAKEMLKDIRFNINETSDKVGYKDVRYFSKLFKSVVGVNPTQFRQMFAQGEVRHG